MKRDVRFWDHFYLFLLAPMPWGAWCALTMLLGLAAGMGFFFGWAVGFHAE